MIGTEHHHAPSAAAPPATASAPDCVDALVAHVVELFTLPDVAVRVMAVARDPSAGAMDLKNAVESDPALSARILRVINSSHTGLRCPVTNLQHAVSLLGFSQIRNLALTGAIGRLFACERKVAGYSRAGLWRHLVTVAVASRFVALRCGLADFEEAFLAGLLHDLGIVVADQQAHGRFARALLSQSPGEPLCAAERRVFGFDHCALGAALGRAWGFPAPTLLAIEHHHDVSRCPVASQPFVGCIELANVLATRRGVSSIGRDALAEPIAAMGVLELDADDGEVLRHDLDEELDRSRRLFEL